MTKRGLLNALFVAAATAAVGLVAVNDAAGGTAPAAATTPSPSSPSSSAPSVPPSGPSAPNPSPFPPGAPGNLTATATSGSVTLSWTPSQRGCCVIAQYDIMYYQSFDDVVWTATAPADATGITITRGIQSRQQYSFTVVAIDDMGRRSDQSNRVTVVTPASDTGPDVTPPSAPADLTATRANPETVTLTWSPATDDVALRGYNVYWFDGWYSSRLVATVAGTTYTAVLPQQRNQYYVRAVDTAGNVSIATNTVTVNDGPTTGPPVPPQPPTCTVGYSVNQWTGGFTAAVTVTHNGDAPIDGWVLAWRFPGDQKITQWWNGAATQTGADVTVSNAAWNGKIGPGGSVTFGVMGTWGTSNATPTGFALNGAVCSTT